MTGLPVHRNVVHTGLCPGGEKFIERQCVGVLGVCTYMYLLTYQVKDTKESGVVFPTVLARKSDAVEKTPLIGIHPQHVSCNSRVQGNFFYMFCLHPIRAAVKL